MQVWGNCSTSTTLLSAHSDAKMPTFYDLWADVLDTFIRISEFFLVTVMLIQVGTFETVPCRHCPHQEDFSFYRASIYSFCLFLVTYFQAAGFWYTSHWASNPKIQQFAPCFLMSKTGEFICSGFFFASYFSYFRENLQKIFNRKFYPLMAKRGLSKISFAAIYLKGWHIGNLIWHQARGQIRTALLVCLILFVGYECRWCQALAHQVASFALSRHTTSWAWTAEWEFAPWLTKRGLAKNTHQPASKDPVMFTVGTGTEHTQQEASTEILLWEVSLVCRAITMIARQALQNVVDKAQ